jgi:hypothetical protein
MKKKISFTIDAHLVDQFKKQRILHCCANDSQFAEWIFRQVLYKPKALLRIKAREHAQKLAFIQEQMRDLEETQKTVDLNEEKTRECLVRH